MSLYPHNSARFFEVRMAVENQIDSAVTTLLNQLRNSQNLSDSFDPERFLDGLECLENLTWFDELQESGAKVIEAHLEKLERIVTEFT